MAQSGFTPISIYYSSTASNVPTAANLVPGELAINTNDGKLYYEDSSGVVQVLASKSTGSIGGSNTQVQFNSSGSLGGSANFVWDNTNARLGIGTSSPAYKLEVVGTIYTDNGYADNLLSINGNGAIKSGVQFKANGGGPYTTMYFDNSTNNTYYKNLAGGGHLFYNGTTQAMTLDASGNLLVGTTSALANSGKVQVLGAATTSAMNVQIGTDGYAGINFNNSGAAQQGYVQINASTVLYVSVSDYRLKENIVPMTGALAKVAQLKPVTYKWKSNGSDGQGFIAHELAEVCPDAVSGEKDAIDADGKPKYQGIDTSFLVATLTKAIQEQQTLIESLTTRLTALENK